MADDSTIAAATSATLGSGAKIERVGWSPFFEAALAELDDPRLVAARVAVEHRILYEVTTGGAPFRARLPGRFRHRAADRLACPAVGDFVAIKQGKTPTIEHVLPRRTALIRQAAGGRPVPQILAANIDTVMVMTSLNDDPNVRRVERYVAAIEGSGARPVIVLNKADLCDDRTAALEALGPSARAAPVLTISARTGEGLESLAVHLGFGRTVALVGSSGVGKSTLANALIGEDVQAVEAIRERDGKGRHTTTQRCLIPFDNGPFQGVLIDTPGIRELELWESEAAVHETFDDIETLAQGCRFRDCAHAAEPDCVVRAAVEAGEVSPARLESYHKLLSAQRRQQY